MSALPEKKTEGLEGALVKVLDEQRKFEQKRATRLGRGTERVTAPASRLIRKVLPPKAMQSALDMADRGAGLTLPKGAMGHDVNVLAECEAAALRVQAVAAGTSAATGGFAGWFGGVGMTVDIPATITLAARNVRATGLAYGFAGDSEDERIFRLMMLELATTIGFEARQDTLARLNKIARELNEPEMRILTEKAGDWVMDKVIDRVGRALGVDLLKRKAGQVVPIAGGLVGAGVNASFQTDVSRAARYGYRQRWLMHRRLIGGPED